MSTQSGSIWQSRKSAQSFLRGWSIRIRTAQMPSCTNIVKIVFQLALRSRDVEWNPALIHDGMSKEVHGRRHVQSHLLKDSFQLLFQIIVHAKLHSCCCHKNHLFVVILYYKEVIPSIRLPIFCLSARECQRSGTSSTRSLIFFCRHAADERVRWHVFCHDGTSRDDDVVANRYAWQNRDVVVRKK